MKTSQPLNEQISRRIKTSHKSASSRGGGGIFVWFLVVFLSLPAFSADLQQNQLKNHPSPYLAMHGKDPVHWQSWSSEILKQAKQHNKLIFLSSGYFSCHWCHVMQAENYQDQEVATQLNRHYISIKLDRELVPAMDQAMIDFSKFSTGAGGWPQHVILSSEGYPLVAFIYQTKPQLLNTLRKTQALWQQQPGNLKRLAKTYQPTQTLSSTPVSQQKLKKAVFQQLNETVDDLGGGYKTSTRFPPMVVLKTLLDNPEAFETYLDWIELTLEQMVNNHLYDHINGGFYRYTIDPNWQTPHFEKMLYNQALLAQIYFKASKKFQRPDWQKLAEQTLLYVEQQLTHPSGLFVTSQSAVDKDGVEGGNYLYPSHELDKLLQQTFREQQANELKQSTAGWTEYETGLHPSPTKKFWPELRQLLKKQSKNQQTPTDSKATLSWNALLASAYIEAYRITQQSRYKKQAETLIRLLYQLLNQAQSPKALDANNKALAQADIQDYAFLIQAITDWQNKIDTKSFSGEKQQLINLSQQKFLTSTGWLNSLESRLPFQASQWHLAAAPLPSPSAILYPYLKPSQQNLGQKAWLSQPLKFIEYLSIESLK